MEKVTFYFILLYFLLYIFFVFCLFWATPAAYGGSQARGPIGTIATSLPTADPSRICDLHHSSQQRQILNPLSEARDRTCNLRFVNHWATTGTLPYSFQSLLEVYVFLLGTDAELSEELKRHTCDLTAKSVVLVFILGGGGGVFIKIMW